jgi:hypothetical protein
MVAVLALAFAVAWIFLLQFLYHTRPKALIDKIADVAAYDTRPS